MDVNCFELLDKSEESMMKKYERILSTWNNSELQNELKKSIKIHLPDNNWRLIK